jgi:hypothetical protein
MLLCSNSQGWQQHITPEAVVLSTAEAAMRSAVQYHNQTPPTRRLGLQCSRLLWRTLRPVQVECQLLVGT